MESIVIKSQKQSPQLQFNGYWLDSIIHEIPAESGVYCVYTCTIDSEQDTVLLNELIFIGESKNARERIRDHEMKMKWEKRLEKGESLCYSFAQANSQFREIWWEALVNFHEPVCNKKVKPKNGVGTTLSQIGSEMYELREN